MTPRSACSLRFLFLTLLFITTSTALANPLTPRQRFDRWLNQTMQSYQIPAVSIVVIRDFKIDWIGTYGVKNIVTEEPISDTTLFQAGSISKPVTATAVLIAAQDEDIDLNESITPLLTSWKIPQTYITKDTNITIKELLSRAASIDIPQVSGYPRGTALPTLLQILKDTQPANSPKTSNALSLGEHHIYLKRGYTIIQKMLVDLYHKPFYLLMDEMVLEPLSMSNSTFEQPLPVRFADYIATPYLSGFTSLKNGPYTYVEEAAAGLWTTPFDLAKFIISIQESLRGNPYQLLKPAYARLMMKPVKDNMGLGFIVNVNKYGRPVKNGHYFMHLGQNEGYRCALIASKSNGYGAIIMTNMAPSATPSEENKINEDGFMQAIIAMLADLENWR